MTHASYWQHVISIANTARKLLDDKPSDQRVAYGLNPGSILNAYREGDATFAEAVEALMNLQTKRDQALQLAKNAGPQIVRLIAEARHIVGQTANINSMRASMRAMADELERLHAILAPIN